MVSNFSKKAILVFSLLFFVFGFNVYAQTPPPVTENVSISATVSSGTIAGGGGGSGGGVNLPPTSVMFSGKAYPGATVSILKNGVVVSSVLANEQGVFSSTLEEAYSSTILYSLYATDLSGNRSILINYPIIVSSGYLTQLSGVIFPPTAILDKAQVKEGDYLTLTGYALPTKDLQVVVEDVNGKVTTFSLTSDTTGRYRIVLPITHFTQGDYYIHVKYFDDTHIGKLFKFIIGNTNIPSTDLILNIPGDYNSDEAIDLKDFSVLAFWYNKKNVPSYVDTNKDGIVNLVDFSILAYYWTN